MTDPGPDQPKGTTGLSRTASLFFAIGAYAIFFATFLYLIIFVGDLSLGSLSPRTVDNPPAELPVGVAVVIDLLLIATFGVGRSLIAGPRFKRAWARTIPPQIERSVYVLITSVALMVLFRFWQPIDAIVWSVRTPILHDPLSLLFWIGWLMVLVSSFSINHFQLLGLQQAGSDTGDSGPPPAEFRTPLLYKWVRHPIYAGFLLAFWATPEMTVGHFLLAAGMTVYALIAIRHDERELIAIHGRQYQEYRDRVGMLAPRFRRREQVSLKSPE